MNGGSPPSAPAKLLDAISPLAPHCSGSITAVGTTIRQGKEPTLTISHRYKRINSGFPYDAMLVLFYLELSACASTWSSVWLNPEKRERTGDGYAEPHDFDHSTARPRHAGRLCCRDDHHDRQV